MSCAEHRDSQILIPDYAVNRCRNGFDNEEIDELLCPEMGKTVDFHCL